MSAAGIVALLASGDRSARTAAFAQLTALASRQPETDAQLLSMMLELKNLRSEMEDEAQLEEALSRYGSVLAATCSKGLGSEAPWALVTFEDADGAKAALASAPSLPATFGCTVARADAAEALGGGTQREVVRRHQDRVRLRVVSACVRPLLEASAQLSDADEFRRSQMLLMELFALDRIAVGGEYFRDFQLLARVCAVPNTMYDKEQWTRADAMTIASTQGVYNMAWCYGTSPIFQAAGEATIFDFLSNVIPACKLFVQAGASPAAIERLALVMLDIVREQDGTAPELSCVWFAFSIIMGGRPQLTMVLVEAGILDLFVSILKDGSPMEWVTSATPLGMQYGAMFHFGWALSTVQLPVSKTQLLIEKGVIDVVISALKAYELRGASKVSEANVLTVWCSAELLAQLDLSAEDARPIVQMLEGIPSTLKFVLEHELVHFVELGYTTSTTIARVCALAFGKEEEGADFTFSQGLIDLFVRVILSVFSGPMAPFNPTLPSFFLTAVRHLCISDSNKELLVRCPDLVALLTDALFLAEDNVRQSLDTATKAAIQEQATECLLQLALFPPGRDMLARQGATMEALHSLDDGKATSFTEQSKLTAHGAIIAVEGRVREPEPETDGEHSIDVDKHIMVSYQWAHQRTVERIVRTLQLRSYLVWFDLDLMKGNTMVGLVLFVFDSATSVVAFSTPHSLACKSLLSFQERKARCVQQCMNSRMLCTDTGRDV